MLQSNQELLQQKNALNKKCEEAKADYHVLHLEVDKETRLLNARERQEEARLAASKKTIEYFDEVMGLRIDSLNGTLTAINVYS